ncbi:cytochrome P450 [Mycena leptocephala]|nr:cytochrome P450 [Mycena leptocephala]
MAIIVPVTWFMRKGLLRSWIHASHGLQYLTHGQDKTSKRGHIVFLYEVGVQTDHISSCTNAVDFIKPLQYFPSPTRTRGLALNVDITRVYGGMIQDMQRRLDSSEYIPDCLIKTLLETTRPSTKRISKRRTSLCLQWPFRLVIAGIIQWFLALMAAYPSIATAANAEVDHVVGRERLPTIADEKDMPYWQFIPKDTVVLLNCWTIHHNEERYTDAFTFNPNRYMGDDLSSSASSKQGDPMKRDHWTFGAGAYTFHQIPEEPISLQEYERVSGGWPVVQYFKGVQRTVLPLSLRTINVWSIMQDHIQTTGPNVSGPKIRDRQSKKR